MKKTVLRKYAQAIVRCGLNVQKGQESGGECPVELRSWVGLQLMDGLREADHLPAKRWSDYSVVWGAEGGVEQGEGACLERPVKTLL